MGYPIHKLFFFPLLPFPTIPTHPYTLELHVGGNNDTVGIKTRSASVFPFLACHGVHCNRFCFDVKVILSRPVLSKTPTAEPGKN